MPFWHMLEDQLQVCRDMNLIHVKTEQLIRWDENARREDIFNLIHRIAYYVYARLAWNPSASADAILRDFAKKSTVRQQISCMNTTTQWRNSGIP